MNRRASCAVLFGAWLLLSCSSDSTTSSSATIAAPAETTSAAATSTTTPEVTTTTVTSSTTTTQAATTTEAATTSTTIATTANIIETRVIGQSVQGRDITAYRMGTPGGRPVLLIGVIHGNEAKGDGITQMIRAMPTPKGIDLWIIDSINPDGQAADIRYNANGVDLNRNVSYNWTYIPKTTADGEYSGEAPADQPETQALEQFVGEIKPYITMFWHQDANRVSPGGAHREIPTHFAELVGLSAASTPCTGGCTGTFTQYINHTIKGGTAFIVELPANDEVTPAMVKLHAEATLQVIAP
ncbi:MAG: M14 family zinc carboxypeptidase [Ilumatobacteraceae bacterium]